MRFFLQKNALIIVLILICFISRAPQLLSSKMILDIDECVLGLMAKHQFEVRDMSFFFWGQSYGFSFLETSIISMGYAIGGITAGVEKLSLLVIWILGIVFFYKALKEWTPGKSWMPFLICLVFIFSPAWAVASMKTYLTPFLCSSAILYLLFRKTLAHTTLNSIIIGILLALVFETQPLWLPGLLLFVVYKSYCEKSIRKTVVQVVSIAVCLIIFASLKTNADNVHNPHVFDTDPSNYLPNIMRIQPYLYAQLHGWYFLLEVQKPEFFASIFACITIAVIYFLFAAAIYYLFTRRKDAIWFIISTGAILLTLSYTIIMVDLAPRYLLPITGFTLFSLFLFIQLQAKKQAYHVFLYLLIFTGGMSLYHFKDYSFCKTREPELKLLIQKLETQDIHYIYCPGWMLQWQISFYSNEQVIARHYNIPDRHPAYTKAVDRALYLGKPVAICGYDTEDYWGPKLPSEHIAGYFICYHPNAKLLRAHFKLWPETDVHIMHQ